MKIAFYGSSLLSSYWNGAATYYRGLLKALSEHGHDITFYEPDVYDRRSHRDIGPPDWCRVVVYPGTIEALGRVTGEAVAADVVIKASGVGFEDDLLLAELCDAARPGALKIFWDVDAPATLAALRTESGAPLRKALPRLDLVLTYGGGEAVVNAYRAFGAADCIPIYNALDPDTHFPVAPVPRFTATLSFLGNRLPDREARVEHFLFEPAAQLASEHFILGGAGWKQQLLPQNVEALGHVPTAEHNAFNCTPRAVLNISREDMARLGYSPATRVFEAAGAGACIITDAWEGVSAFFEPESEILVARDGKDVAEHLRTLTPQRAAVIGRAAMVRALSDHTYQRRAEEVNRILLAYQARARESVA